MYRDRWLPPKSDGITTADKVPRDPALDKEKTFKVRVNLFQTTWAKSIHQYRYDLPDPKTPPEHERMLLEKGWPRLKQVLDHFVILWPGRIYSPTSAKEFKVEVSDRDQRRVEIHVYPMKEITAADIHAGKMGAAEVVGRHIANKLASPLRNQRVGKRFYKNDCPQVKGHYDIISGFCVNPLLSISGPLVQVDVMHRPAGSKSIVEVLKANLEGTDIFQQVPQMKSEWLRFCVSSTVVTSYNFRVYRIKHVHFDMTPMSSFDLRRKDTTQPIAITFAKYFELFYDKTVAFKNQPLLEAYPEKSSERVFLLPEFCCPTGVTDEMRKEKSPLSEVLKQIKVSPQERHNAIVNHAEEMRNQKQARDVLEAWGCRLGKPLEVPARQLDPLQVAFTEKKIYCIEEGSFARSLRNGVQCAVQINEWLLLYPQTDEPVLEIWLRSLRDVSKACFGIPLADPVKVCCNQQHQELPLTMKKYMTPNIQLVLLLIPSKDVRKVYTSFKQLATDEFSCISQVVRSDTIRKRQSVGSILHKVVQQINAKFCGPLWHIIPKDAEDTLLLNLKKGGAFMVFGIDVYVTTEGTRWLGLTATLDKVFSQYYSMAAEMQKGSVQDWRTSLSVQLQHLFRDALQSFADCNEGILPETIIVYRASVNEEDWPWVEAGEVKALQQILDLAAKCSDGYSPRITFITIARKSNMRIFNPHPDMENIKNPEPGTIVDDPTVCGGSVPNFYLVSQAIMKGSAVPAHYSILINSANLPLELIENLTNRLCLMYYNVPNAVRVPAPVLYATKIALFCGTVTKKPPKPRLQRTLFFL